MPADAPLPDALRATRRVALAGGLVGGVAVLAAGCDALADRDPEPGSSASTGTTPEPSETPVEDPDTALVEDVRTDIAATAAVVTGAGRGRPKVARTLRGFDRLHRSHLDELPDGDADAPRTPVRGTDAAALSRVRGAESRLQRRLAEAAVAADSGSLASLLASMSAAVAQELARELAP